MKNLKILVVDDDPVTLLLLKKKLTNAEYEVDTAKNGNEAVQFISESFYDVVLTDLMMPGGPDGIGVLEAVKARSDRTEVILLTAYASVETAVEAMKKGAADYLQKPINFDELFIRLGKINHLKKLLKDAGDLREAMDVTECNAAQTIQDLEMKVAQLDNKFYEIKMILSKENIDAYKRVRMASEVLSY